MAEVPIIPKIRCDNCGLISEKERIGDAHRKPRAWGGIKAEGSRSVDSYGGKERLDFSDLCPDCASGALGAAAEALKQRRAGESEVNDKG